MDQCPCGSGKEYEACCGEIIGGKRAAPTAEALMRSRYSAFVEDEDEGTVEFIATYRQKGSKIAHHELGNFVRQNGRWYYADGKLFTPGTVRNEGPKVGRNDPCPCGSGKKYKKCCGS